MLEVHRQVRWSSLALVLTLVPLALVSCSRGSSYSGKRVIVLGFDGMDYTLTRRFMDEGRLPNFSRLEKQGSFGPLGTSVPPQSPVAWSEFIVGMDAGGHGIFDFVHRNPENLLPYLSTSRALDPKTFKVLKWEVPIGGGGVELLRRGKAFWDVLEDAGIPSHIYRMPANYPPSGTATRELSGMGTPDLLGTPGTFSFYTSDLFVNERSVDGGEIFAVEMWDNKVEGELYGGPGDRNDRLKTKFAAYIDPDEPYVRLVVGEEERVLEVGEWSDWVPIDFDLGLFKKLRGMARFLVQQTSPEFELYVSPINIDPMKPEQPISTPEDFAAELAKQDGRFYTQNMPEDTRALSNDVFSYEEFFAQARIAGDEILKQYKRVLTDFDGGFLFYYFGNLDQICHMMFRTLDPEHPAYDPDLDGPYADAIPQIYEEFDSIVGYTLERLPEDTRLIVMSDHGFASWRRAFHLNRWLVENGYLVLEDPGKTKSTIYTNVDWSRSRAYGLGLNGLYLSLEGREKDGIVRPEEKEALLDEIAGKLLDTMDPATGLPAVTRVYKRDEEYDDLGYRDQGPDIQVGYAKGVRCSGGSAIGEIEPELFSDNTDVWSGDHCMDHTAVPGILATDGPLVRPAANLIELTATVLAEYGLNPVFQDEAQAASAE